jgi:DNA polymerase-3 subunit delta'
MYFKDVVGHNALKEQLIGMAREGHVGHALMFLGAQGSGNLPLAVAFAGYILCQNPQAHDRCGVCPACRQMDNLAHPDLHLSFPFVTQTKPKRELCKDYILDFKQLVKSRPYLRLEDWELASAGENKTSLISVKEAREMLHGLSYKSFRGGHKVLIIWMAERLNGNAANALLKTLEEPEPKTIIMLVVSQPDALPATVVSRTQGIAVPPLSQNEIQQHLCASTGLDADTARLIAWQSQGSWGQALALAETEGPAEVYHALFSEWMRACVKRNPEGALAASQQIASLKKDLQLRFLGYCLDFLHRSVMYHFAGAAHTWFSTAELPFAERFAPYIAQTDVAAFEKTFSEGHYHIERNANPWLLCMKMSYECMRIFSAYEKTKATA